MRFCRIWARRWSLCTRTEGCLLRQRFRSQTSRRPCAASLVAAIRATQSPFTSAGGYIGNVHEQRRNFERKNNVYTIQFHALESQSYFGFHDAGLRRHVVRSDAELGRPCGGGSEQKDRGKGSQLVAMGMGRRSSKRSARRSRSSRTWSRQTRGSTSTSSWSPLGLFLPARRACGGCRADMAQNRNTV